MNKGSDSQTPSPADARPWPEETRELINQALAMCVEKFRFPLAARAFVQRAADLGNPFGQYLWGLVLHYDIGDHAQAWDYFERSAALGYHDSIRHLALLLEGGHVPLKGASRNPDSNADQIRKAACKLYLKAAELDNYQAKYQYGLCCLEGRGRARNYKEAFRWLQLAACQGHKPAQIRLAQLCLNPRQGCHDPLESYIWATVSTSEEVNELLAGLEAILTRVEIDAAQAEAERRARLLEERGRLSREDLETFERPKPAPVSPIAKSSHKVKAEIPQPEPESADPDPSPDIAYQYLSACKKRFTPELVTLELVIPRKLKKTETMDFTRIKITYNGRDTDAKSCETLAPLHIYRAERRLLIRLAAQYSVADPEARAQGIHRIISDKREAPRVSRLNAMLRAIFPACAKYRGEMMINRQTGCIAFKLKIDTTKITNASDYDLCGL